MSGAVDTACSSSLVTTHLAARALREGEVAGAASMGVYLTLVHSWTRACLRAGMLSEDGRSAIALLPPVPDHIFQWFQSFFMIMCRQVCRRQLDKECHICSLYCKPNIRHMSCGCNATSPLTQ